MLPQSTTDADLPADAADEASALHIKVLGLVDKICRLRDGRRRVLQGECGITVHALAR